MANVPPAGRGSRFNPYSKEEVRREVGKGNRRRSMSLRSQDSNEAGQEDEDFAAEESDVEIMDVQKCAKILGIESVETSNLKSSVIQSESVATKEKCSETMDKMVKGGKGHAGISQEVNKFTDSEGIEKREQVKDRSINMKCDKITKQGTSQEHKSKGIDNEGNILQEKYVVVEGELKAMKDIEKSTYDNLVKEINRRFDRFTQGECKIKCKILQSHCTSSKGKNSIKISLWCNQNLIRPISIDMIKYNFAVLTFKNALDANACLDKLDKQSNGWLQGFVDFTDTFSRGVITDWPYEIPELWENIVDKKDIFRIEKMKKRVWDQETKKFQMQFINNFIITLKDLAISNTNAKMRLDA
ncbi:uncharacterized protein LOC120356852 isoform X2 [Solenopsis invicta]|uniref:uncharacterized protein LOC105207240 isoform X2 n=1 Tax=Solenopsis invicta TaxID=13686 RepID=UPI000E33E9FF|nr:uncharacterized protein LOC105207240 isoform X2 [Solenopsis invicta]XP_039309571.1 uncharacterized protein LOC120356852 isoform X2 [Solenopsis invicta]